MVKKGEAEMDGWMDRIRKKKEVTSGKEEQEEID